MLRVSFRPNWEERACYLWRSVVCSGLPAPSSLHWCPCAVTIPTEKEQPPGAWYGPCTTSHVPSEHHMLPCHLRCPIRELSASDFCVWGGSIQIYCSGNWLSVGFEDLFLLFKEFLIIDVLVLLYAEGSICWEIEVDFLGESTTK